MAGNNSQAKSATRLWRERKTLEAMVRIFCRWHHAHEEGLCPACGELLDYAIARLDRCPFGENKPTCARCPVHCYKPTVRDQIRQVMRSAGPWMILYHPWLTILHDLDEWLASSSGRYKSE